MDENNYSQKKAEEQPEDSTKSIFSRWKWAAAAAGIGLAGIMGVNHCVNMRRAPVSEIPSSYVPDRQEVRIERKKNEPEPYSLVNEEEKRRIIELLDENEMILRKYKGN